MIKILAAGDWNAEQVRTTWVDDSRQRHPEVETLIDQTWRDVLARPDVKLYDGPMCRLESWRADARSLTLSLSRTSYKVFVGTNLTNAPIADRFGATVLANPLGLSGPVLTADGYLVLGRRNARVAYYPNRVHPFAGTLEPRETANVFAGIRRELSEEIGFSADDIADIRCAGIVEDEAVRQPELIFRVRSNRTRLEIERRVDAVEHLSSWAIPITTAAFEEAVNDARLTPVAVGAVLLCGNAVFGTDWMARAAASDQMPKLDSVDARAEWNRRAPDAS